MSVLHVQQWCEFDGAITGEEYHAMHYARV